MLTKEDFKLLYQEEYKDVYKAEEDPMVLLVSHYTDTNYYLVEVYLDRYHIDEVNCYTFEEAIEKGYMFYISFLENELNEKKLDFPWLI